MRNSKRKSQDGDHGLDKTKKKINLFKLQVQERYEEITKLKEEFHQKKRKHHEEATSMTDQLDKENKREENLSSNLEQRHEDLNKLKGKTGQDKEEVSSLRSQLE